MRKENVLKIILRMTNRVAATGNKKTKPKIKKENKIYF